MKKIYKVISSTNSLNQYKVGQHFTNMMSNQQPTILHAVRSAIDIILLSVCLSVKLCIVSIRYVLQQKCLSKCIGSAVLGTRRYNFQLTVYRPPALKLPTSKFPKYKLSTPGIAVVMLNTLFRQRRTIGYQDNSCASFQNNRTEHHQVIANTPVSSPHLTCIHFHIPDRH